MNTKKLEKLEKILGDETISELSAMLPLNLQARIVAAEQAIKQAQDELDANPTYLELKENLKALSAGMKEVKKRQNAIIQYSLFVLNEKGGI